MKPNIVKLPMKKNDGHPDPETRSYQSPDERSWRKRALTF